VLRREPAGYFANDQMPGWGGMLGRDTSRDSLSWARGAGGIVAALGDMTRWERALYSAALLPAEQQAELTSLVSTQTGLPIEQTSLEDPTGFGLGVAQLTAPGLGTAWSYEGGTVGFRMLHIRAGVRTHPGHGAEQRDRRRPDRAPAAVRVHHAGRAGCGPRPYRGR
jgi:D-alanyl-D-alanine carboxypeptidase